MDGVIGTQALVSPAFNLSNKSSLTKSNWHPLQKAQHTHTLLRQKTPE
jgi:hypothetical protein